MSGWGRTWVVIAALVAGGSAAAQDARVVAVNYPLQYFAERLLGTEVAYPVPAGVDPSFWRPGIADISAIQSADLILLNGAGFATWTDRVSLPRARVVETARGMEDAFIATESVTHSHGAGGEHSHEGTAAYTWLDPALALRQAEAIADAAAARGLAAPGLDARMSALADELRGLSALGADRFRGLGDTVFVATHPRYQYLARAFGLEIVSLEWDAGAMPETDDLAALGTLIAETGADVLIWEAAPPAAARAAVADLGLEDVVFPPLATPPAEGGFVDRFAAGIESLALAAERARSG